MKSVPLLIFVYLLTKSVYVSINKWREAGHPQVFEGNTSKYFFLQSKTNFQAEEYTASQRSPGQKIPFGGEPQTRRVSVTN